MDINSGRFLEYFNKLSFRVLPRGRDKLREKSFVCHILIKLRFLPMVEMTYTVSGIFYE